MAFDPEKPFKRKQYTGDVRAEAKRRGVKDDRDWQDKTFALLIEQYTERIDAAFEYAIAKDPERVKQMLINLQCALERRNPNRPQTHPVAMGLGETADQLERIAEGKSDPVSYIDPGTPLSGLLRKKK